MAQETNKAQKRPQFVNGVRVRMPEEYDFNTWGKDYSEYNKEFRLRTDAVWQKYQLKDWFRLASKVFFFNKRSMRYEFIEPDDVHTLLFEPWGFEQEEIMDWRGFTKTGVTTAFQCGIGPKQKVETTFNSFYSMPDYYIMCAMRFEKWFRCDSTYGHDRATEYDRSPDSGLTNMKDEDHYPCFREWYEASYACADNIMKFLMELSFAKKAQDFWVGDVSNNQMRMFPTIYDSPNAPERITLTY